MPDFLIYGSGVQPGNLHFLTSSQRMLILLVWAPRPETTGLDKQLLEGSSVSVTTPLPSLAQHQAHSQRLREVRYRALPRCTNLTM